MTSHGYIISPHTITLNSAKLEIGKNGVLFCGYTYPAKNMALPQLEPKNPGTLNVTFDNLTAITYSYTYIPEDACALELYSDLQNGCVFEVDGVYRYSNGCACEHYQIGIVNPVVMLRQVDPNYGNGLWVPCAKS